MEKCIHAQILWKGREELLTTSFHFVFCEFFAGFPLCNKQSVFFLGLD